eukprot:GHVU01086473.1.p1 GENE.GHVU01086473.1~~GHVU01086473.1.p1  ORF type:complete len:128 (+),score=7.45 GHVU01086473.1:125-508(+)
MLLNGVNILVLAGLVAATVYAQSDEFAPTVTAENQRIGKSLGGTAMLGCLVKSNPTARIYWKKNGEAITITGNMKYIGKIWYEYEENTVTRLLFVQNLETQDFGKYVCVVSNNLGEAEAEMTLYETV